MALAHCLIVSLSHWSPENSNRAAGAMFTNECSKHEQPSMIRFSLWQRHLTYMHNKKCVRNIFLSFEKKLLILHKKYVELGWTKRKKFQVKSCTASNSRSLNASSHFFYVCNYPERSLTNIIIFMQEQNGSSNCLKNSRSWSENV